MSGSITAIIRANDRSRCPIELLSNYGSPSFMKNATACACLACLVLVSFGCNREAGPPPPLAADQIPFEFEKGFRSAKPEVRQLALEVSSAVGSNNLANAFAAVQSLCTATGASKEQNLLAVRAMLTITSLLEAAKTNGDQTASATLHDYQKSK